MRSNRVRASGVHFPASLTALRDGHLVRTSPTQTGITNGIVDSPFNALAPSFFVQCSALDMLTPEEFAESSQSIIEIPVDHIFCAEGGPCVGSRSTRPVCLLLLLKNLNKFSIKNPHRCNEGVLSDVQAQCRSAKFPSPYCVWLRNVALLDSTDYRKLWEHCQYAKSS